MTRNRISGADHPQVRVTIVTLDMHLSGVVAQAQRALRKDIPNLSLSLHAAAEWEHNPAALERCRGDIAQADIIVATMLFMDDHIRAVKEALEARREHCDALVVAMSAAELVKLTRLNNFRMDKPQSGLLSLIKKLRGRNDSKDLNASSGARQMKLLRTLPKILRLIPGTAQDVRAYFLTMQYWFAGSADNVENLVRFLVSRYAAGPRATYRGKIAAPLPVEYPELGLYHPALKNRISERLTDLKSSKQAKGRIGLLIMRSYVLAGDTAHYDGVIAALEAKGLDVVPAFATGLDSRPAIEKFFTSNGKPTVDAVVSLTGFSLVGGPAYNDARAAEDILARLDVPYIAAQPVEFQTLERWAGSAQGLTPVEATIMVAIPELDGATAPMIFGGRSGGAGDACSGCSRGCRFETAEKMQACAERAAALAARVARMVALRRSDRAKRRVAIVLFNFPPNSGATGTAAYLSVFASLFNTLKAMKDGGYDVDLPESVDALRRSLLEGNAGRLGTDANVHARIGVEDHVRHTPHLAAIETQWGPAPGQLLTNGRELFVLGARFGNVFVGLQPGFGVEGDPMRLLFEGNFAPTHAFAAFYRFLREDFAADAVLHFGTHGALEFMPGKQAGLSAQCWPERLLGDLPNVYLYAANNPSEGAIAKRRSAATLISYLTPSVAEAGLFKRLADLKALIDSARATRSEDGEVIALIREQAAGLALTGDGDDWQSDAFGVIGKIADRLYECERTLIPEGLHVLGEAMDAGARTQTIAAMGPLDDTARARIDSQLSRDSELPALLHALDGGYIRPAPGGDLMRTPEILPTGRNLHGFDPFRLPSALAMKDGERQAALLLDRHIADGAALPETIAFVLWGTDNLKNEGASLAQVLALMGARPRFDSYGRLCGAELVPLGALGRPRIDVIATLSGIFRDLLPLQTRMLAEAAYLAATADEPDELNFIAKHARAQAAELGCGIETAALRVFSNADGAYGANVNQIIDAACWDNGDELADAYEARKCFAYGRTGSPVKQAKLLSSVLKTVDLAYQNLDSLELGVTTIDHYVDTLGGISRAAQRAKGGKIAVYVGDQTQGTAKVRTLAEQVNLETRTRMLNPRWYDGLLKHGYEGVRQIEAHVTNTMGWSATTGDVAPWVYEQISETFLLDPAMRERLIALNPQASARMANRLLEAHQRNFWSPDAATLKALRDAGDEMEDRLEGIVPMAAE